MICEAHRERSRVAVLVCTLLGPLVLAACAADGAESETGDDPKGDAPSTDKIEQTLTPIANKCGLARCSAGTACNPKTQACEPAPSSKRCTISGDPAIVDGCDANEQCLAYACTNSFPPTCVGTCAK